MFWAGLTEDRKETCGSWSRFWAWCLAQVELLANRVQSLEVNLKEKHQVLENEKKKQERQQQTAIQWFQHKRKQGVKGKFLAAWR